MRFRFCLPGVSEVCPGSPPSLSGSWVTVGSCSADELIFAGVGVDPLNFSLKFHKTSIAGFSFELHGFFTKHRLRISRNRMHAVLTTFSHINPVQDNHRFTTLSTDGGR